MPPITKPNPLERYQVWLYLMAIGIGLVIGNLFPHSAPYAELMLWPIIALLLYMTFLQLPFSEIPSVLNDKQFFIICTVINFIVLPPIVWGITQALPPIQELRLGLFLVLVTPCTDWFITFTYLGHGDAIRAMTFTPISLIIQLVLLPVDILLFPGIEIEDFFNIETALIACIVVFGPLLLAYLTQRYLERRPSLKHVAERGATLPIPLLALLILIAMTANVVEIENNLCLMPIVVSVTLVYLVIALLVSKITALTFNLPATEGRTVAFSVSTRNSFVILPFTLALPTGWELTPIIIIMESIIELLAMVLLVKIIPQFLFRSARNDKPVLSPS